MLDLVITSKTPILSLKLIIPFKYFPTISSTSHFSFPVIPEFEASSQIVFKQIIFNSYNNNNSNINCNDI